MLIGGELQIAQQTANHENARTTGLVRSPQQHGRSLESRKSDLSAGMEKFTDILQEATERIAPEYFLLPIHGAPSVYRERVYCYELYHQIRLLWLRDCQYCINGEVDKRAHPYFQDGGEPNPDLLVHVPGTGDNYAVIEVKSCRASDSGIQKDLETLTRFRMEIGYARAIYLVYGERARETIDAVRKYAKGHQGPVEVWLHPAVEKPAFCI